MTTTGDKAEKTESYYHQQSHQNQIQPRIDPHDLYNAFVKNFPHPHIRNEQEEALAQIADGWCDHDVFFLDAPTGVGKSAIAEAVSKTAGSAYVMTSTKALQDQYQTTWDGIVNLKGRGNYDCALNPSFRVDHAPCIAMPAQVDSCMRKKICHYYNQRDKAMSSKGMLTSYAYFMASVECGVLNDYRVDRSKIRDILILDEVHELDSILADFMAFDIDKEMLSDFGLARYHDIMLRSMASTDRFSVAIAELAVAVSTKLHDLNNKIEGTLRTAMELHGGDISSISKFAAMQSKEMTSKRDSLDRFDKKLGRYQENWITSSMPDGKIRVTPLVCDAGFDYFIGGTGRKIIAMSASLGDPRQMCAEFGIDPARALSVSVGSPFPPALSPVVGLPVLKMSKKDIDASLPLAVEAIDELISQHPNDKGIVHTGNYKVARAIMERSKFRSRLIGKDGTRTTKWLSNEELIRQHSESKQPTVLVSPSMHTGVDLRDELSRFQIIAKLPWPSLEDPRIKKKSENGTWYANEMLKKFIQASGRSTRSETDSSITYVLDSAFRWVWEKHGEGMPQWFKDRVRF